MRLVIFALYTRPIRTAVAIIDPNSKIHFPHCSFRSCAHYNINNNRFGSYQQRLTHIPSTSTRANTHQAQSHASYSSHSASSSSSSSSISNLIYIEEESDSTPRRAAPEVKKKTKTTNNSSSSNNNNNNANPWQISGRVPRTFWSDVRNHHKFFEWAAQQLNVQQPEDWYRVSPAQIRKLGGAGLLVSHYDNSLSRALATLYPHVEWLPWRFESCVPMGFWADHSNHRRFFDWVAGQLGVQQLEDWYAVSRDEVSKRGGTGLLANYYDNSLPVALFKIYPDFEWEPWRFASRVPSGFWDNPTNHRRFLDWVARQLNVQTPEDWYRVTSDQVNKLGGSGLLSAHYGCSLKKALMTLYPEVDWLPWRFSGGIPNGFWDDIANQRRFFDWVATQLGITEPEQWYNVRAAIEEIKRFGGAGLLANHYDNSLVRVLTAVYPEVDWIPWRFADSHVPVNYWQDPANHRKFFDWAAQQLGVVAVPDDWYNVRSDDIRKLGGGGLLGKYENSLTNALLAVYPEVDWLPWRFSSSVPIGFWSDMSNQRRFFDWAAQQLNIDKHNDGDRDSDTEHNTNDDNNNIESRRREEGWYQVTIEDIARLGGAGLLSLHYNSSLSAALKAVYPNQDWKPWRFRRVDNRSSCISREDIQRYIEYVAKELGIQQLDEWYRVSSVDQIRPLGGYSIIQQNGGLYAVLKALYPEHGWVEERFHRSRGKKSAQRWLQVALRKLFPCVEIIEEYSHPHIYLSEKRGDAVILDMWLPSLSLAFEYQGQQHYHDIYFFGDSAKQQQRDADKKAACKQAGVTLVVVPYWWDRAPESLAATIVGLRPDLIASASASASASSSEPDSSPLAIAAALGSPIPTDAPHHHHNSSSSSKKPRKKEQAPRAADKDEIKNASK